MITLPYINGRAYVHSSSFVTHTMGLKPSAQKINFDFHRESLNNRFEFLCDSLQPLDKRTYNVTGQVDGAYFGFREVDYTCSTQSRSLVTHSLNSVPKADAAWMFSQHMKEQSAKFYAATKQRLLLSSLVFLDLHLMPELSNFNMVLRVVDSRLQGMFYHDDRVVCRIRMLVRNK